MFRFNENFNKSSVFTPQLIPVRVIDIVLDNNHPDFKNWESIGLIKYKPLKTSIDESSIENLPTAYPISSNIKNYPLKNEIVFIISAPSFNSQNSERDEINYYINIINIWNSSHHNALPDIISNTKNEKDYSKIENNFLNEPTSQKISLGNTFKEQDHSPSILPYEGDYIMEGRFGNSIRFGNTVNNSIIKNTWSENGDNGSPIIFIRNKKFDNKDYIVENINDKASYIILSEDQKINIDLNNHIQNSFKNENYIKPNQYIKRQIILNSERIVLNSFNNDLLLFSNNSIGLSSLNNLNIDVKNKTIINSPKIYLGQEATEPLLLGNKAVELLKNIFEDLNKVVNTLTKITGVPSGVPYIDVNIAAKELSLTIQSSLSKLDSLKSKQNYTL